MPAKFLQVARLASQAIFDHRSNRGLACQRLWVVDQTRWPALFLNWFCELPENRVVVRPKRVPV